MTHTPARGSPQRAAPAKRAGTQLARVCLNEVGCTRQPLNTAIDTFIVTVTVTVTLTLTAT
eukprot:363047-Chlamydomonas_euryale.AAC.13